MIMVLNKVKGNMYNWVSHTWNPIKGECSHDCEYCYMKVYKQKPLHLSEKELNDNLGEGNFIFVGSSTDMFAKDVPHTWIYSVLAHCVKYHRNNYLFQTKNTSSLYFFKDYIPDGSTVGTTIETNREYKLSKSPDVQERAYFLGQLDSRRFKRMVTLEPIMDFDLNELVLLIRMCRPNWVNIGADSKGHHLPEPPKEKILALIEELRKFTEVKIKDNLKRLTG